jgi:hypothetical protein
MIDKLYIQYLSNLTLLILQGRWILMKTSLEVRFKIETIRGGTKGWESRVEHSRWLCSLSSSHGHVAESTYIEGVNSLVKAAETRGRGYRTRKI